MAAYENTIPMSERSAQSFDYFASVPTVSSLAQRSRSLGHEARSRDYGSERPNLVVSGMKKFTKAYFTGPRGNLDLHANKIVEKLEEDKSLMEDTPVSEQLRKEALKNLPQGLTMKRCVKSKLTKSVSQKSKRKPIGFWKRLKYSINISFSKFVASLKNFNYFELWHGSLKDIEGRFGSGYASYFKFLRWLFVMNFGVALLSLGLLVVPQIILDTSASNKTTNTQSFNFRNIFIGDGFFIETVFYYGHYTNQFIEVIPHLSFDMPASYFSVTVILYVLSFVVLAVSVAESYRRTFIETEGGLQNVYANRIFCGWDYGIATKEAAQLKSSSIYYELKELLSEELKDVEDWSCLVKFWTYTIQVVVNILVLVILAAVGWMTWVLMKKSNEGEIAVYITALVINIIIMVFPSLFYYISKHEDYKNPRITLYITLGRTYLLGAVILGTILAFWLIHAEGKNCWETLLAAEVYRLIIFDFLFSVVLSVIVDVGYFIGRYFLNREPKTEFNIAKHTLQIIYNQGLLWVGFLYSPILPAVVTLKMFIIWYVNQGCVRKLCRPPKRTWRAAQTQTWFMMMIFVSILLIIATHGYALKSVRTSQTCGPFKHYNYTYEIVTTHIEDLEQDLAWRVIMNVTKPGGLAFIMIALGILVYYLREHALANRDKVKMLKETLVWLAKDKKFLVQMYNDVTKGEINPHLRDNRFVDPSRILPHEFTEDVSSSVDEDDFHARFKKYS
ncbi:transmembrane channel-like protein 3 isoform X2 [Zophobas morio]